MAQGDTVQFTTAVMGVYPPKVSETSGKAGPWKIKTDLSGGAPEWGLKSWEHPGAGVVEGAQVTFTCTEGSTHPQYGTDYMIESAAVAGMPQPTLAEPSSVPVSQPVSPTVVAGSDDSPASAPHRPGEKEYTYRFQWAMKSAQKQLGEGCTIEEYQARAGVLLASLEQWLEQKCGDVPF